MTDAQEVRNALMDTVADIEGTEVAEELSAVQERLEDALGRRDIPVNRDTLGAILAVSGEVVLATALSDVPDEELDAAIADAFTGFACAAAWAVGHLEDQAREDHPSGARNERVETR